MRQEVTSIAAHAKCNRCRSFARSAFAKARPRPRMTRSVDIAHPPRIGGISHLVAAAGAAVDFLAGAELQVLAHADPHFAEPGPVAGHRDRGVAQAGIDLDEGVLDLGGRDASSARPVRDIPAGFSPPRAPCGWSRNRPARRRPEQVPCLSHSLKISPGAGIRSSIEDMMLRSSRGEGRWQYSGKPRSYCGHSPWTTKENGRPPHWACERPLVAALGGLLAEGGRPGQRQHVEIELAGGILPAVLRRRPARPWRTAREQRAQNEIKRPRQSRPIETANMTTPHTHNRPRWSLAGGKNISRTKRKDGSR